jgi:hypothetical protein
MNFFSQAVFYLLDLFRNRHFRQLTFVPIKISQFLVITKKLPDCASLLIARKHQHSILLKLRLLRRPYQVYFCFKKVGAFRFDCHKSFVRFLNPHFIQFYSQLAQWAVWHLRGPLWVCDDLKRRLKFQHVKVSRPQLLYRSLSASKTHLLPVAFQELLREW